MILISACLVNISCRYDGKSSYLPEIMPLLSKFPFIALCPEVLGGLSTPRKACEILQEANTFSVLSKDKQDFTKEFMKGADIALEIALKQPIQAAILKSKSPSCGRDFIYDGTFTKKVIAGHGLFAQKILDAKIPLYTEKDYFNFFNSQK